MSLKQLPTESMPREKLLQRGPQSLSDAELLAIFLRTGTQGMNVLALADSAAARFWIAARTVLCLQGAVLSPQRVGRSQICSITSGIGDDAALSR